LAQSSKVRDFREEDLPEIIELCEQALIKNPHFTRSEASLSHFLINLGHSRSKAFVTEEDGGVTGFVIISITMEQGGLKQGNILELQVKDGSSLSALVNAASDYCNLNNVDAIVTVAPLMPETNNAFKNWLKFDTGVMMTKTLSPAPLLEVLLSSKRTRSLYAGEKISFHIGEDLINVEITPTKAYILQTGEKQDKSVAQVFMSPKVFLKLTLGQLNPYTAYISRKLKLKGAKNTFLLLKLLFLMRLHPHFFTSLTDRM
jgi:putative sterol carrier protein